MNEIPLAILLAVLACIQFALGSGTYSLVLTWENDIFWHSELHFHFVTKDFVCGLYCELLLHNKLPQIPS